MFYNPFYLKRHVSLLFILLLISCNSTDAPAYYELSVTPHPEEAGTVQPPGGEYEAGTGVELFAEAADGWEFRRWEGDIKSEENPAVITVEKEKHIRAVFEQKSERDRTLTFELTNSILEIPADGIGVEIRDPDDTTLGEGETRNGSYTFTTVHPEDSTLFLKALFSGRGYLDFSGEIRNEQSRDYNFLIHPAPLEIEASLPALDPGEEKEIDLREFITSIDPDDGEPIPVDSVEVSDASQNLEVERRDAWSFIFTAAEDAEDTRETVKITAHTAFNQTGKTVSINIRPAGPGSDPDPDPDPDPDSHLVIMPLGDSLTNDPRSRVKLWNLLVDDSFTVDYVGNYQQETSIPDPDHEGVGGITIQKVEDKARSLMTGHKPEFVNLLIGTNDIAWYFDETAEETARRWDDLVQVLFNSSGPDIWIIAATIPPLSSKIVGQAGMRIRDRAVQARNFNEALRNHVQARQNAGQRILLADMEAVMNLSDHVSDDGVHLSDEGYDLMGTVYYETILQALNP